MRLHCSSGGVLKSLLEDGHSADTIFEALSTQQTELVLTAHPTEVNRRTILEKQRRVQTVSASYADVSLVVLLPFETFSYITPLFPSFFSMEPDFDPSR
jgi:hypothetical protein